MSEKDISAYYNVIREEKQNRKTKLIKNLIGRYLCETSSYKNKKGNIARVTALETQRVKTTI